MRLVERMYEGESRKISDTSSIHHFFAIVQEELQKNKKIHWKNIVVLLLHDSIRSHPERFREVFDIVPLDVFYRILKLSNLSAITRHTIYDFLKPRVQNGSQNIAILDMLSYDLDESHHTYGGMHEERKSRLNTYISQCREYLDLYYPDMDQERKLTKLNGLFRYVFFDEIDAQHKLSIIKHNFSDINIMSSIKKRRYMLSRIPKFQALAIILQSFDMMEELEELKQQWIIAGGKIGNNTNFIIQNSIKYTQDTVPLKVGGIISI